VEKQTIMIIVGNTQSDITNRNGLKCCFNTCSYFHLHHRLSFCFSSVSLSCPVYLPIPKL